MISAFSDWLVFSILNVPQNSKLGGALHFFVYDSLKIILLLLFMTILMGFVNSYFPTAKIRAFLSSRKWYGADHLFASLFGAITPFCSCSSIPLFIGFLKGGIPLGVTLSFLITSPLVNEVAVAMFVGLFGWKVTLLYTGAGILTGALVGAILGRMHLEKHVEDWVWKSPQIPTAKNDSTSASHLTLRQRAPAIIREALDITGGIIPYVLIGIGMGAAIHGFVPTGYFEHWITKDNPLAVPVAVLLGVPMYANATSVIPILQALVAKGVPIGTALAFSMAVGGLSLPEAALLRKVMKPKLIFQFFASVTAAIILLGYLFNIIL